MQQTIDSLTKNTVDMQSRIADLEGKLAAVAAGEQDSVEFGKE